MLGDKNVTATLAVKDLEAAKKFYQETLGLKPGQGQDEGGQLYQSGDSYLFIYPSQFAGTNQATAATWTAGEDFVKIIQDLEGKGVKFEQYDNIPGATRDGNVHSFGELKAAWFKDPDGNILNVINKM